ATCLTLLGNSSPFCLGCSDGNRIRALNPRRNEENQLGRTFDRALVPEQISDKRQTSKSRHLPNIDRVVVDEDSANHSRAAIRYQTFRAGSLRAHRWNTVHRASKVRLAVFNLYSEQDGAGFGDLRRHRQLQRKIQKLSRDGVVDVGLNRDLRTLRYRRGDIV